MANLRVDKITSTETFEKTGSVQFDGTDDHLNLTSSDIAFGTGDFTLECWVYFSSKDGSLDCIMETRSSTGTSDGFLCGRFQTSGHEDKIELYTDGGYKVTADVTTPDDTWVHVAVVRQSGTTRVYVNGTASSSTYTDSNNYSNDDLIIGENVDNNYQLDGFISNFRMVKGTAVYTSNFKPSMRELEVVPGTVLLACQSKTDASLEKTGKTLTANGGPSASELTPGILTPIVKSGGGSAITGSVEFTSSTDALVLSAGEDFAYGTGDFTIEAWIQPQGINGGETKGIFTQTQSGNDYIVFKVDSDKAIKATFGSTTVSGGTVEVGSWHHVAVTRASNTVKIFVNGIASAGTTVSTDFSDTTRNPTIGQYTHVYGSLEYYGFISNFRINKGTALYTDNFIPPTRKLKRVPGTVLLCCQDPNNPLTEVTGKTITGYGDLDQVYNTQLVTNGTFDSDASGWTALNSTLSVSSGQLTITNNGATNGRATSTAFNTVIGARYVLKYNTITSGGSYQIEIRESNGGGAEQAWASSTDGASEVRYFQATHNQHTVVIYSIGADGVATKYDNVYVSKVNPGKTGSNFTPQIGDDRQVTFEGVTKIDTDAYFYLPTGDTASREAKGTHNAGTRGVVAGGYRDPAISNIIEYITIASKGNSKDFGDLTSARRGMSGFASNTRGIFAGGNPNSSPNLDNRIDYITIATTGNAKDFGDCVTKTREGGAAGNQTRGILHAAEGPSSTTATNSLQYVTIQTSGNALDFGDLTIARTDGSGQASSPTRGIFFGGYFPSSPNRTNTIDYVTIATTSNAIDFGDMMGGGNQGETSYAVCSNSTRAIRAGGVGLAGNVNRIDYITIASTGNANDFGDLSAGRAAQEPVGSCASSTRGVIAGGFKSPAFLNIIDYVTIQSTGDALDFGDLIIAGGGGAGVSNGHGGLG